MNLKLDVKISIFSAVNKLQFQGNDVTNTPMGSQCVLNHIKIKMCSPLLLTDSYLTSLQLVLCRVAAVKRLPVHQP